MKRQVSILREIIFFGQILEESIEFFIILQNTEESYHFLPGSKTARDKHFKNYRYL
jgi:hypothetical protein